MPSSPRRTACPGSVFILGVKGLEHFLTITGSTLQCLHGGAEASMHMALKCAPAGT